MKKKSLLQSGLNVAEWLHAFDAVDRPTAEFLLANVEFVTRTEFTNWTVATIQEIAAASSQRIATFAIREVKWGSRVFPDDPEVPPEAAPGGEVGSEGSVAHLLNSLGRTNNRTLAHPSINVLRNHKVADIVLVDDIVGTGSTAASYLAAFYKHPTIRSWISRKLLTVHIVSYAQLDAGLEWVTRLCSHRTLAFGTHVEVGSTVRTLTRHWSRTYPPISVVPHLATNGATLGDLAPRSRVARIRKLVEQYGTRWGIPQRWRHGYKQSFALIAFEHGCPNNVPGLIWYDSKRGPKPLIPGRLPVLDTRSIFGSHRTEVDVSVKEEDYVLDCLVRGTKHASAISRRTGLPPRTVHVAIGRLRDKGLVDANRRPLPAAMHRPHLVPGCVELGSVPYLPRWRKGPDDRR